MQVEEKYVGKKGRCVKCKQVFIVAEPPNAESTPAADPPVLGEVAADPLDPPPFGRNPFEGFVPPVHETPSGGNPFEMASNDATMPSEAENPFTPPPAAHAASAADSSMSGPPPWVTPKAREAAPSRPTTPPPVLANPDFPQNAADAQTPVPTTKPKAIRQRMKPEAPRSETADFDDERNPTERPTAVPLPAPPPELAAKPAKAGTTTATPILSSGNFSNLKIDSVDVFLVNLPCKATFVLSGGTYATEGEPTPRVLVKIVGSNGIAGWGEVTPCPTWCYETSETIVSTIRRYLAPAVRGLPAWDLDQITRAMERAIQCGATIGQPLAKAGIDTAIHDMLAHSLQVPLHVLFGAKRLDEIWLSYIVSGDSPDSAAAQAQKGIDLGYTAFKIKIGMNNESTDRRILRALGEKLPKGSFVWVDANQGYSLDVAVRQAKFMGKLGVQAFEQPLKGSRISGFRRLVEMHEVPIAIDETLGTPADLVEYIKQNAVDLPVAKVQRCGGHWNSVRFCAVAEAAGLRLMGSGLCESDLGLAHGIALFAAFGIDLPCDLNGRQFVESVFVRETVSIRDGRVAIPDRPGCGIEVDEDKVRQFAVASADELD